MLCLLKLLLLHFLLKHDGHTILARRTLLERVPKPSATTVSNFSAVSPLIQADNSSRVTPSAIGIYNSSHGVTNVPTPMPAPFYPNPYNLFNSSKFKANYKDITSGFCAIGDDFCSFKDSNETIVEAIATNFSDQCLLWDASCSGNRTLAIEKFFDITFSDQMPGDSNLNGNLLDNDCFAQTGLVNQSDCQTYNPPERLSDFEKIKNWMRSSQCVSAANEWIAMTGHPWGYVFEGGMNESHAQVAADGAELEQIHPAIGYDNSTAALPSCCGVCDVSAQNVDLYYWPEPDADLSCLSIIGETIRPLDYGATTTIFTGIGGPWTDIYWGCNSAITGGFITTAEISTIGSLAVKVSSFSPWSSSPCGEDDAGSQPSNQSIKVRDGRASVYKRGHSLIVPSITQADGLPVSTAVSGDFTFTSPSIYANFYNLTMTDNCGGSMMSPMMLSFSPGELSTIVGNLAMTNDGPITTYLTTQQFDFKDLPCPPQSIMEANWYKPQPGEPYRPLIAMPSQLKQMNPWFSYCTDALFTAFDPPSALTVASALAPLIPPTDPKTHPWAPVPNHTLDPGARQTSGAEASIPVPASVPTLSQPKATTTAASAIPKQEGASLGVQPNDPTTQETLPSQPWPIAAEPNPEASNNPQQSNDPQKSNDPNQDSDPQQASGSGGDSGQEADPKPNSDPNQVDSNQGSNRNVAPIPLDSGDPSPVTTTIAGHVITAASDAIAVADTTLTRGAPPITVSGTPIHFGPSALVVGTSTIPLAPKVSTQMITTIAGQAITAAPSIVAIAGNTLSPGAPGTKIDGTILSLDTAGQFVVGSKIIPLASKKQETMTTTIGGQVITAAPNGIAVAGTTLSPGAPGMTVGGTLLSLDTASQLVIGSKTIPLESTSPYLITTVIGGQVITAAPNAIAIAGTALTPGAAGVTVGGTLVSLNTAGQLVVGAKTIVLQSGTTGLGGLGVGVPSEVADPVTTTIDGQIITAGPTALAMAGTTLTPGAPAFIINGTLISLNTAAQLVVGSKTIPLESERVGSSGETAGLGGLIMGGFGAGGPFGRFSTNSPTPTQGNTSTGAVNGTNTGVQAFKGDAASLEGRFLGNKLAVSVIAISVLAYMC